MKNKFLFLLFLFLSFNFFGQSIVKNVPFTNIGPSVMSGRVVDFDVNPDQPTEFYVAYASGGLWYTNNNGTSFTAVTETAPTQNMGDVAVDWKSGTIYIGTGESNSSRSSYAGIGILKSTDKGKTWTNVGLTDSHHIGRMIINKNNTDEVVVGAIGHLYSSNAERGIFKTTDGGKSWKNVLFIDENMPGMSGVQCSEKIRENNKEIPIVLVTGANIEKNMFEAKISKVLKKPYTFDMIQSTIKELLQ